MPNDRPQKKIPVEIVYRHAHLSSEDFHILFGKDREPEILKPVAHEGQFVYKETVTIAGPDSGIKSVRVLGPFRKDSQVEVSASDAAFLGVKVPERASGDLSGSAPCRIIGLKGQVELQEGLIVPKAHLHCSDRDAEELGLSNGDKIAVESLSEIPGELKNVIVRVHPTFKLRLHLSVDQAARLWLESGDSVRISE